MSAIVIESSDAKKIKILTALAEQLGSSVKKITNDELEDLEMVTFIKKEKTGVLVSREDIFKILDGK